MPNAKECETKEPPAFELDGSSLNEAVYGGLAQLLRGGNGMVSPRAVEPLARQVVEAILGPRIVERSLGLFALLADEDSTVCDELLSGALSAKAVALLDAPCPPRDTLVEWSNAPTPVATVASIWLTRSAQSEAFSPSLSPGASEEGASVGSSP